MNRFLRYIPVGLFTFIVVVAILYLTLAPDPLPDEDLPAFEGLDKIGHFCMFGGLCFAMCFDMMLSRAKRGGQALVVVWWQSVIVAVVAILFGALIEVLQTTMGLGRSAEWADLVCDSLGALISAFVSPHIIPYIIRCR